MRNFDLNKFQHTPRGAVISIAIVVVAAEFLIMLVKDAVIKPLWVNKPPFIFWDYADPLALSLIVIPALYAWVLRPMQEKRNMLQQQNAELERLTTRLREEDAQLSAQHQHEIEARERMILIEKMSSLGTMVGGVAHEINNPLMGVMNYVEYARDKAVDGQSIEVLDRALHEIRRIEKIVKNMLVFVRYDGVAIGRCDVAAAIKQTAALLEGEFRKHALQLQLELPEDLPQIKCDAGSLQQVLVNLLLNARDALAGQTDKRITLRGEQVAGRVVLSVCDNGPGISEPVRKQIFTPFFTIKPVGQGTGLGLAVSRQLVEAVGGNLNLHEQSGYGACFRLEFDAA